MRHSSVLSKYILALLLFGSNGVVASTIHLGSVEIVLLRSALGCILLATLFLVTGNRLDPRDSKRDLFYVALSGVAMAADWLFLFEAYAQIGVSLGMLINYTGPAIVIGLSPALILRESLSSLQLLGTALILGGALFGELDGVWHSLFPKPGKKVG